MMPSKWTGYNYTGMLISVLTHLQNISLPYMVFPAEELYNAHVGDISSKEDRDKVTLNQRRVLAKSMLLTIPLNHSFMCTVLVGITDRIFLTLNWYCFM